MIAPLIRVTAYVSNLTERLRSYFSIASSKPKTPSLIKSLMSTLDGRCIEIRPATYFTRCRYLWTTSARVSRLPSME